MQPTTYLGFILYEFYRGLRKLLNNSGIFVQSREHQVIKQALSQGPCSANIS